MPFFFLSLSWVRQVRSSYVQPDETVAEGDLEGVSLQVAWAERLTFHDGILRADMSGFLREER